MTDTHLTPNERVMIEAHSHDGKSVLKVATRLKRSGQTIHNVYKFLLLGKTATDYYQQYKGNKTRCGRCPIVLPPEQQEYVQTMVAQGWTPGVIIGRAERPISGSFRTLYRKFKANQFDYTLLPMKGKRKANGHKERSREASVQASYFRERH